VNQLTFSLTSVFNINVVAITLTLKLWFLLTLIEFTITLNSSMCHFLKFIAKNRQCNKRMFITDY
jgi:hypothetical protein